MTAAKLSVVALWAFTAIAFAQEPKQLAPDPVKLAPDWWNYYVLAKDGDSDELVERIDRARKHLVNLKTSLEPERRKEVEPILDGVLAGLSKYERLKTAEPPAREPLPPPRERYTVTEFVELIAALRKTRYETESAAAETANLARTIDVTKRQLSEAKVTYLELASSAPERLKLGLEVMQKRLHLEVLSAQLQRRRISDEAAGARVDALKAAVSEAAERLEITPEQLETWRTRLAEATRKADAARHALAQRQVDEPVTLSLSELETAQAQTARQQTVLAELQAAVAELEVFKWRIAILLSDYVLNAGGNTSEARAQLRTIDEEIAGLRKRTGDWRRFINQTRRSAATSLADETDETLKILHENRLVLADRSQQSLVQLEEELAVVRQLNDSMQGLLAKRETGLDKGVWIATEVLAKSWEIGKKLVTASLFEISDTPVTTLGLFRVIVILVVAWWLSKLLRAALGRVWERSDTVSQNSIYTLGRILHYLILTVGIIVGLSSVGIDFTKFALLASALGVGIGFGLQTLVSNFVAGLIILFEKSLKVGDFVELESGVTGEVREINMRSTLITTNDNVDLLIPNSEFVNGRVTNWTLREVYRRIHIPFGVAYGSDKERVKKAALEAADAVPWTLKGSGKREPQVWFVEFGDSSLNFELVVWLTPDAVKRPSAVESAYLWEIESCLAKYDLEVPFPQRDLHVRSVLGRTDEDALRRLDEAPGTR